MTYTIYQVRSSIADWAVYDWDDNLVYRGDSKQECQDWIDLMALESEDAQNN